MTSQPITYNVIIDDGHGHLTTRQVTIENPTARAKAQIAAKLGVPVRRIKDYSVDLSGYRRD